jgi:hypothetical protein
MNPISRERFAEIYAKIPKIVQRNSYAECDLGEAYNGSGNKDFPGKYKLAQTEDEYYVHHCLKRGHVNAYQSERMDTEYRFEVCDSDEEDSGDEEEGSEKANIECACQRDDYSPKTFGQLLAEFGEEMGWER